MLYTKNDWKFMVRFASKAVSAILAVLLITQTVPQVFATGGTEVALGLSSVESTQRENVRLGRTSLLAAISGQVPAGYQVVEVGSARDLADLAARVNAGEFASPSSTGIGTSDLAPGTSSMPVYVRLTQDINLMQPDAAGGDLSVYWEPIGTEEQPFTGIFNGGGHMIYGLDLDMEDADTLFGNLVGATVQNLLLAPAQELGLRDNITVEGLCYTSATRETFYNVNIVIPSDKILIEDELMGLHPEYDWFYEANKEERRQLKEKQVRMAREGKAVSLLELAVPEARVRAAEEAAAAAQAKNYEQPNIAEAIDSAPWIQQMQPKLLQPVLQTLRFNAGGQTIEGNEGGFSMNSGEEEDKKYYIRTIEQLQGLSNLVAKGHTFKQQVVIITADLDGSDAQGGRKVFKPIGSALVQYPTGQGAVTGTIGQTTKQHAGFYTYFGGRMVGAKDKTSVTSNNTYLYTYDKVIPHDYDPINFEPIRIKNVQFVPSQTGDACGLFANTEHAIIENLVFENCASNGVSWVGMVTGVSGNTVINRVGVEGGEITGSSEVGGLVGFNRTPLNDDLSYNNVTLGSTAHMIWQNTMNADPASYVDYGSGNRRFWERGQFFNSYCTANITGSQNVGGIIGFTEATAHATGGVIGCIFSGTLVGQVNVGGIMGNQSMTHNNLYISHCATSGTISGTAAVGGIVGFFQEVTDSSCKIQYCYSSATITGASNVGGIVGTISNYSTNATEIKKNYFSGTIASSQLAAYTVTNTNHADLSKITIGPIVGSGTTVNNSGTLRMYDNYFCRMCYSELKYEGLADGQKPDDNVLQNVSSGIGKQIVETHKTQSCNNQTGTGTKPNDCISNYSALPFDSADNMSQGTGATHWTTGTLIKEGQEWYYSHGDNVQGNHPRLMCFDNFKFGYPAGTNGRIDTTQPTIFKAFSSMSTLANMEVPSELFFSAVNNVGKSYNGKTYKYTLTTTQNGKEQYKYINPQGIEGWRIDYVDQGITLIANTNDMPEINGEKIKELAILDETVPSNFHNLLVVQEAASTGNMGKVTVYADYPPNKDVKLKVYTMADGQEMGIGYDVVIRDSGLRIQEDADHMPAALLPSNLDKVQKMDPDAKYLSVYDKAFVFRFPTHEELDLTNATVEIHKWATNLGHQVPNGADKKLVAKGEKGQNGGTTSGNNIIELELSTSPNNVLRVTSKDNKEIIEPNNYYEFSITVKDAAGNSFVTTANTLDSKIDGNSYIGRSYDDNPPTIVMQDPKVTDTSALEYIAEGDPVQQHYANNLVDSGTLTKTMVDTNGNIPGQKFNIGGELKWNDTDTGKYNFGKGDVKYQVLQLTVGTENTGVYTRGIVTYDGVDPISLMTKDSQGEDLIKLTILDGGIAPGTNTAATLDTFQEIAGTYRIIYQVKDIREKMAATPVVRYYIVYQTPQMIVTENVNKELTYNTQGLPETGLGQNGAAKSYTEVDFTVNETGMHQLADMFYLQLQQGANINRATSQALNVSALQQYGQFCIYQQTNQGVRYMIPQINPLSSAEVAKLFTPDNPSRVLESTYALHYAVDPVTRQPITQPIGQLVPDFDPVKLVQMVGEPVEGFENISVRIRIPGSLSSMLSVGVPASGVQTDATGSQVTMAFKSDSDIATSLKTSIPYDEFQNTYHGNVEEAIAALIGQPVMYWNAQQSNGNYKVIGAKEGFKGKWDITKTTTVDGSTVYKAVYKVEKVYSLDLPAMGISITSGTFTLTVAPDPNADNIVEVTPGKVDPARFWEGVRAQIEAAQPGGSVKVQVPYELRYAPIDVLRELERQNKVILEMTLEHNIKVSVDSKSVDLRNVPDERHSYNVYVGKMNNLWITRDALGYRRHFQQFYTDAADEPIGTADTYYGDITITMPLDRELQDSKNLQLYTYSNQNRTYTLLQNIPERNIDRTAGTVTLTLTGVPRGEYILGTNLSAPVLNPSTGGYALDGEAIPEHIIAQAVARGLLKDETISNEPLVEPISAAETTSSPVNSMLNWAFLLVATGGLGVFLFGFLRRNRKTDIQS